MIEYRKPNFSIWKAISITLIHYYKRGNKNGDDSMTNDFIPKKNNRTTAKITIQPILGKKKERTTNIRVKYLLPQLWTSHSVILDTKPIHALKALLSYQKKKIVYSHMLRRSR